MHQDHESACSCTLSEPDFENRDPTLKGGTRLGKARPVFERSGCPSFVLSSSFFGAEAVLYKVGIGTEKRVPLLKVGSPTLKSGSPTWESGSPTSKGERPTSSPSAKLLYDSLVIRDSAVMLPHVFSCNRCRWFLQFFLDGNGSNTSSRWKLVFTNRLGRLACSSSRYQVGSEISTMPNFRGVIVRAVRDAMDRLTAGC